MAEERSEAGARKNRYLTFYLEKELYGIDIMSVQEIIAMMKTTAVPKTPKCVKGVMNLRGNIIPVVELRTKFQMQSKDPEMHTAIIIVKISGTSIGFIVDQVEEVVNLGEDQLSDPPQFGSSVNASYLKKMAQNDEQVIMILNLDAIFADEELAGLENITK